VPPKQAKTGSEYQDVVDRNMARELLAATMREHGPYSPDGSDRFGGNFWRAATAQFSDGTTGPSPLHEYAQMVMTITRRAYA
jgi:hypothetical protein